MVGKAVIMKRPVRPGFLVTSMEATLMEKSPVVLANSSQLGFKLRQAEHQWATLGAKRKRGLVSLELIPLDWSAEISLRRFSRPHLLLKIVYCHQMLFNSHIEIDSSF